MTVRIYNDFDGVYNALSKGFPKTNTQWQNWNQDILTVNEKRYPVIWANDLITEIKAIYELENVTPVWLTTWQKHVNCCVAPVLGMGKDWENLLIEDELAIEDLKRWWKLDLIQADIKKHQPDKIIWLDDDIRYDPDAITWLATFENNQILAISPNSYHGLTRNHIRDIINFISE